MVSWVYKQRIITAAIIGAAGALVALTIAMAAGDGLRDLGFIRVAAAGAFLSGLLVAPGFGGAGTKGWFLSGLAFGAATVLGAVVAVILMPVDAALFGQGGQGISREILRLAPMGPIYVGMMMVENLAVAAAWLGALACVQLTSAGLKQQS
ncbi:MAG: hypothetical protein ACSHWZ_06105 [Sulfitobacter sp.]